MKNRRLTFFIVVFSSFAIFGGFAASVFAQDAIQCKAPSDPSSGINLNNNLRLINNTETLNDIYMGTGEIYLGSDFANTPYITKSGSSLSLQGISADVFLRTDNNVLFQTNDGAQTLAGVYAGGAPAAVNDSRFLIVNGNIEGWNVNALGNIPGSGLCVQGSCIYQWSASCVGTQKLTASGNTFICADDVDTDTQCDTSGTCNQLCIGADCVDSWAKVTSAGGGSNITMATNLLTIGSGATLLIDNGGILKNAGIYQACDAGGVNCVGTGRGVSKIINTDGTISISPASGDGDVTISVVANSPTPCAPGFTRTGNECRTSFGTEPLIRSVSLCNSGDPSLNNWATLDISDLNATNAVFAIVRSYCGENKMYIRETGSGIATLDATNELCYAGNDSTDWNRYTTGSRYIKLDGNKDFDWYNIGTDCGNNTLDARIYLSGYIEN